MIRLLLAAVALTCIFPKYLSGQFYVTGENPAKVKWNTLKTENFNIVYPSSLDNDARKLAVKLELAFDSIADLRQPFRKKFPVLMQNASVYSNGFVTLAPRRMELQVLPPQDSYSQNWISQLALHEFRHVAQLNKLNQGTTRILGLFSGEIARGAISAQVPSWFFEGDAVYNETRLSQAGRGRSAGFDMPLRTVILEKNPTFSYDKSVFGSYLDFVPDAYIYGYKMTGFLRSQWGDSVWSDALSYVARHPYQIWPFSFYLKKNFGFYKQGLYHKTIDSLKQHYNEEKEIDKATRISNNSHRTYSSYLHPMQWNNSIISYHSGFDDAGSFLLIDSMGNEKRLFYTGSIVSGDADIHESELIWDEIVSDPRWEKRNFSVIKKYDLKSGRRKALTRKTRYFSPDFSPDGTMIAVAENDLNNQNYLTIIDAEHGNVIMKIPAYGNAVLTPEWSGKDEITMILISEAGKQLETVNLSTGERKVHIPFTPENIYDPLDFGPFILFRTDTRQIENIVAIRKGTDKIYKVTNSPYGARYPYATDNSRLVYSDYSAEGFDIALLEIDTAEWTTSIDMPQRQDPLSENLILTSEKITSYSKILHLFRFHSWLPFYTDPDQFIENPFEANIYPGLTLFSQNTLGTAISSIGYSYRQGDHYIHPSFIWRGWYPVFEFTGNGGGPQHSLSLPDGMRVPENATPPFSFSARVYVPLSFSRNAYSTFMQAGLEYEYSSIWYSFKNELKRGIDLYHLRITAGNYRRMSERDLYPVWGQSFSASLTFQPSRRQYGQLYALRLNLFFPGIVQHHHLFFHAGYQQQNRGIYLLPFNRIDFPRGYTQGISEEFTSMSVNYSFPFAYPDLSLGPFLYIKRLRAGLFYDIAYGKNLRIFEPEPSIISGQLLSAGTEITSDFHALRMIFPISAGIRIGYKPLTNKIFAELMLVVNTRL